MSQNFGLLHSATLCDSLRQDVPIGRRVLQNFGAMFQGQYGGKFGNRFSCLGWQFYHFIVNAQGLRPKTKKEAKILDQEIFEKAKHPWDISHFSAGAPIS